MPETPAADALPEDLDVTAYVGPYLFPDIRRRRIAAVLHAIVAAVALARWHGESEHWLARRRVPHRARGRVPLVDGVAPRDRSDRKRSPPRAARSGSRSGTRPHSSDGAGCALARRGGSWCTRPTRRRRCVVSSKSTRSMRPSWGSTPSRIRKTGRSTACRRRTLPNPMRWPGACRRDGRAPGRSASASR